MLKIKKIKHCQGQAKNHKIKDTTYMPA